MADRKVISIGCQLPGGVAESHAFDSRTSLLDWDIIVFVPDIDGMLGYYEDYQGKPCLDDSRSFRLREASSHWKREIKEALAAGKTVFVYLTDRKDIFVATGTKDFSGAGRNARITRHVGPFNNYESLPFDLEIVTAHGTEMQIVPGTTLLTSYWHEFAKLSSYRVRIGGLATPMVVTRSGSKPVGGILRLKENPGTTVFLPNFEFGADKFFKKIKDGRAWTATATQVGAKLISALLSIDTSLRNSASGTPPPPWIASSEFDLLSEQNLRAEIASITEKQEKLSAEKEVLHSDLQKAGLLKRLLFETGRPLEQAIIQGLTVMGFTAAPFRDSTQEFDVIFSSREGRFLGEAEGKDTKPIDITKMRQLETNIHEDLARPEVTSPAKAVLFGNAQRLLPLSERKEFFTAKCFEAAKRTQTALVRTPDLFRAAKHLSDSPNKQYAKECRKAIFAASGAVVNFPDPPIPP